MQSAREGILDAAEEKGEMDVMRDLATPLPVLVIAQMMGVPPAERRYIPATRGEAAIYRARRV